MNLATTLARLDALPATLESLRAHYPADDLWLQRAEQYYPFAIQALERLSVAVEENQSCSGINLDSVNFIELLDRTKLSSTICIYKLFIDAFTVGNVDIIELLLIDGRVKPGNYYLVSASIKGYSKIVNLLLKNKDIDPTYNYSEALRWASLSGRSEIVKILLEDGRSDPTSCNYEALRWAKQKGHMSIVAMLMDDPRVDLGVCKSIINA